MVGDFGTTSDFHTQKKATDFGDFSDFQKPSDFQNR